MLSLFSATTAFSGSELISKFNDWKVVHKKSYGTSDAEATALAAFASNEQIIMDHNFGKNSTYKLGHNEFSDLTWDEFSRTVMSELYLNKQPKNKMRVHLKGKNGNAIDDSVDWVAKGAVTPVKNQQRCGSCWAFSTVGAVEGALAVETGKLISLSEEELVQCDHNGDQGCQGGLMDNAFEWMESGNKLTTETAYPYTSGSGTTGTCDSAKEAAGTVSITSHKDVPVGDEDALKSAVAQQPVAIAIEADKSAFQLYKSGVFDSASCGTKLDHGVLLVGYGTDSASGKDYWKVKNSWGTTFGEEGYIRMVRGKDMCGIAQSASYPTGAKSGGTPPSPGPSPTPPSPPAPPPTPSSSHYEDPKGGCMTDEIEVSIQGVQGGFCTPACSLFKACPKDVPAGVTAQPQCALQDSASNKKYCALICSPSLPIVDQKAADDQCGTNASCKQVQLGIGICTYDD